MPGINKIILVGNVAQEPSLWSVADDNETLRFTLATTINVKKDGKTVEETEYHIIVMAGSLAHAARKLLKKDKLVYIEGKSRRRASINEIGEMTQITEIAADSFTLLRRSSDFGKELNSEN